MKRRASSFKTERLGRLYQNPHEADCRFVLHYVDLTGDSNRIRIVQLVQRGEIYNLGARSHVAELPESETTPFHPRSTGRVARIYAI